MGPVASLFMTEEEIVLAEIDFEKTKLEEKIKSNDTAIRRLTNKVVAMQSNTAVLMNETSRRSVAVKIVSYEKEIGRRQEFDQEMQKLLNRLVHHAVDIELGALRARLQEIEKQIDNLDSVEQTLERPMTTAEVDEMTEKLLDSSIPNVPQDKVVSSDCDPSSEQAQLQ